MPDLLDQHDPVLIHWAGATYEIMYDKDRNAGPLFVHPPRWYAQRQDRMTTERYYSSPVGAFTAIYIGSASWVS